MNGVGRVVGRVVGNCSERITEGGWDSKVSLGSTRLEKHCWRLVIGGSSLLGNILKNLYYPKDSFMEATMDYQPSYA